MVTPRRPDRLDVDGGTAELRDLRALVDLRPAWWAHAACRGAGVSLFFLEPRQQPTEARTYCARCTVTDVCLAVAMDTDAAGILAGTTPTERRAMRRRTTTTTDTDTTTTTRTPSLQNGVAAHAPAGVAAHHHDDPEGTTRAAP